MTRTSQHDQSMGGARAHLGVREAPYSTPGLPGPIDLWLDANESGRPSISCDDSVTISAEMLRRYPDAKPLEAQIAAGLGVSPSSVIVTAGGDEAIDRVCRVCLGPSRELVVPVPTFEMITRHAAQTGAMIREVDWGDEGFPTARVVQEINEHTGLIAVVSPNNPTGEVVAREELGLICDRARGATVLVDLAYTEFADEDLTQSALEHSNAVIVRTLSKAYGLAGVRVGYAVGPERLIRAMRAAGSPFPVSSLSLAIASRALGMGQSQMRGTVAAVHEERSELLLELERLGARVKRSQGNFVLADTERAEWLWRALGSVGIAVRWFDGRRGLDNKIRLTCPGDPVAFDRLRRGLRAAFRPDVILFDADCVAHGVRDESGESDAGPAAAIDSCDLDRSKSTRAVLAALMKRVRLGVVSTRSQQECERLLRRSGLTEYFGVVVGAECAADNGGDRPSPVTTALKRLGAMEGWLIGQSPTLLRSGRASGVVTVRVGASAESDESARPGVAMEQARFAVVISELAQLQEYLP